MRTELQFGLEQSRQQHVEVPGDSPRQRSFCTAWEAGLYSEKNAAAYHSYVIDRSQTVGIDESTLSGRWNFILK